MKRWLAICLSAVLLLSALSGCGGNGEGESSAGTVEGDTFSLSVRCTGPASDLDPARAAASNTETITYHLFENLLRWEDDGTGKAVLANGMASSYTEEKNNDGSTTYTFLIRSDARWSDGESVTASDFVYGWQRLFSMENPPGTIHQLYMVEGFDQAWGNRDGTLLTGVYAEDDQTLVIKITEQCAYFLDTFCAGTLTMPVRADVVEEYGAAWGTAAASIVTNGPYTVQSISDDGIVLEKSETYYGAASVQAQQISFSWLGDAESAYQELTDGELNFLVGLPESEIENRSEAGTLTVEAEPSTYALLLNNLAAPFDNETVRQAFAACVDTEELVAAAGSVTATAATGFVPHGIVNRDDQWQEDRQEETGSVQLPEDLLNGADNEAEMTVWDYRAVGDASASQTETTREERASTAQELLSQAGYPNGQDFPEVTYLYEDTPENQAVAEYLQSLWQEMLNVTVALEPLDGTELRTRLLAGESTMAAFRFDAAYDDATAFLNRWDSEAGAIGGNLIGFNDRAYDLLLYVVPETASNSAREACLHDAEQILLSSCGVVPLFYYGRTSQLSNGMTGVYGLADGTYFFWNVGPADAGAGT